MGRGNGNAEVRGGEDDGGGAGLGSEAIDGVELHHLVAKSLDNAPTAESGARGHADAAGYLEPEGDANLAGVFGRSQEGKPIGRAVEMAGQVGIALWIKIT